MNFQSGLYQTIVSFVFQLEKKLCGEEAKIVDRIVKKVLIVTRVSGSPILTDSATLPSTGSPA